MQEMPQGAPPAEAPVEEAQGPAAGQQAQEIGMGMEKLLQTISSSQASDPQDVEELGGILQAYKAWFDRMSGAPGEGAAPQQSGGGAPMEAGATGKPYSPAGV